MSVNLPDNQKQLTDSTKTDFQRENQQSNPWLKNNYIGALLTGASNRVWDFYLQLKVFQKEIFGHTAIRNVPMFAEWWNVPALQAARSTGNVISTGTPASAIASGEQLQSSSGKKFETTALSTIATNVIAVTSITRSGSEVTVVTTTDHNFSSQTTPTIAGAVETEYNLSESINVISPTIFTYDIDTTPSTPATGTITATLDSALTPVQSLDFDSEVNINSGEALTYSSTISGIDNIARADFNGVTGGANAESVIEHRGRIVGKVQNPITNFNAAAITLKAREVSGVTRVWVQEITPAKGSVTIYFVRDNDATIIPAAGDITTTKAKIVEIKPAVVDVADVIVSAPTPVTVNFAFTSITPDTTTMREAIEASLNADIRKQQLETNYKEDNYRAAITGTVDRITNTPITDYTLTLTGDVTVTAGEIAVLGTVTF